MSHRRKIKKKICSHTSYTTDEEILTSTQLELMVIKAIGIGTDSIKMISVQLILSELANT